MYICWLRRIGAVELHMYICHRRPDFFAVLTILWYLLRCASIILSAHGGLPCPTRQGHKWGAWRVHSLHMQYSEPKISYSSIMKTESDTRYRVWCTFPHTHVANMSGGGKSETCVLSTVTTDCTVSTPYSTAELIIGSNRCN